MRFANVDKDFLSKVKEGDITMNNRNLELTINSGRIYEAMDEIAKAEQDFKDNLQKVYNNTKLSDEGKKAEEALYSSRYVETCKKCKENMQEAITTLQNAVITDEFRPSQEMDSTIDFITTMKAGGCLSPRLLDEQLAKFKGQEMNLIFLREKLKDCVGASPFDKFTFSGYSTGDIDNPPQFIEPTEYFNQLRTALEKNDSTTAHYLMDGLESRLGIESVAGREYRERQAMNDCTTDTII